MSYYHGLISSRRAIAVLSSQEDGSFLLRDSQSQPGSFVLSAKSAGRVYHVLIFHKGGQYYLDSAEEGEAEAMFDSLDDLVVFCMGHELRVEGTEVQLHEAVPCTEEAGTHVKAVSFALRKTSREEDSDQLTDLFATLFGARCTVLCVAHSNMSFDGQPLEEGRELLAVMTKDIQQKGFFIRVVDPEKREVVGEKRITKTFQYDAPGHLVMTYLSQHGITCVSFSDARERDRFLHQVDRVVQLQQDKAVRVRARGDSEAKPVQNPTEITHRIKASQFDIDHLTPEWQYLFDQAGVTRSMLEDRSTLQFILDTIYKIGGAPLQLDTVKEEAASNVEVPVSNGTTVDSAVQLRKKERLQVLAVDHTLRHESLRASKLSQELRSHSLQKGDPAIALREPSCPHLHLCERFKDHLMIKHALFALGPEQATCFCEHCSAGQPMVQVSGSPPQQYSLPLGWSHFVHRSQSHALARQFCARWHVAYCSVPCFRVAGVMRTGQLPHSHSSGEVLLSPDITCACRTASITPASYFDEASSQQYRVSTAFQVYIQPESYSVQVADTEGSSSSLLHTNLLWHAPERTYIVHALLIRCYPMTDK